MTDLQRFNRYYVFNRADLELLPKPETKVQLSAIAMVVTSVRQKAGKKPLECVVVESDWPEYEQVKQLLENRYSGLPAPTESDASILDLIKAAIAYVGENCAQCGLVAIVPASEVKGDKQSCVDEELTMFSHEYVSQLGGGIEDSYYGKIWLPLPDGQYLEFDYYD